MSAAPAALDETLDRARAHLLAARNADGHWRGRLSSSALATATAVGAWALADRAERQDRIARALDWLAADQNADGGWGDTPDSGSNIATTLLAWSAHALAGQDGGDWEPTLAAARSWLARQAGSLEPDRLVAAVHERYGNDRTFSAPILTMGALAGRLGGGRDAWHTVAPLPFELGALPHRALRWLRLPVVSYALPAMIAIGLARQHHRPSANPLRRLSARMARRATLQRLTAIQPESGGYLEAPPLTAFVAMALASTGRTDHPAVRRGLAFLDALQRDDGSLPIDTDLATWLTTQAIEALAGVGPALADTDAVRVRAWLLAQQHRRPHVYTGAAPGGWAWTDRAGGVPDADDTAGALVALRALPGGPAHEAASHGIRWLMDLQNRDGGIPTFCRGWGRLPFDRSCADLTAHALRAWRAWRAELPELHGRIEHASRRALAYLQGAQRADGAWLPLWFGNEASLDQANPTYGTARVLAALAEYGNAPGVPEMVAGGAAWLCSTQGPDGGWGGDADCPPSVEETALAVDAMTRTARAGAEDGAHRRAAQRGAAWLIERTDAGRSFPAAPIGLYFAELWYAERLYPVIFTVSALSRLRVRRP